MNARLTWAVLRFRYIVYQYGNNVDQPFTIKLSWIEALGDLHHKTILNSARKEWARSTEFAGGKVDFKAKSEANIPEITKTKASKYLIVIIHIQIL